MSRLGALERDRLERFISVFVAADAKNAVSRCQERFFVFFFSSE
jgi:hypothetical protein